MKIIMYVTMKANIKSVRLWPPICQLPKRSVLKTCLIKLKLLSSAPLSNNLTTTTNKKPPTYAVVRSSKCLLTFLFGMGLFPGFVDSIKYPSTQKNESMITQNIS